MPIYGDWNDGGEVTAQVASGNANQLAIAQGADTNELSAWVEADAAATIGATGSIDYNDNVGGSAYISHTNIVGEHDVTYTQALHILDFSIIDFFDYVPPEGDTTGYRWKFVEFDGGLVVDNVGLTAYGKFNAEGSDHAELLNAMAEKIEWRFTNEDDTTFTELVGFFWRPIFTQGAILPAADGYVGDYPSGAVGPTDITFDSGALEALDTLPLTEADLAAGKVWMVHSWPFSERTVEGPAAPVNNDSATATGTFLNLTIEWRRVFPDWRDVYAVEPDAPTVTLTRDDPLNFTVTWPTPDHEEPITGYEYTVVYFNSLGDFIEPYSNEPTVSNSFSFSVPVGYNRNVLVSVRATDAYGHGASGSDDYVNLIFPPMRMKQRDDGLGIMGHARITNTSDIKNQASSRQFGIRIPERQTYS